MKRRGSITSAQRYPLLMALLAEIGILLGSAGVHASPEVRPVPVCKRSHRYAVQQLAFKPLGSVDDLSYYGAHVLNDDSDYVPESVAQQLVASGSFVPVETGLLMPVWDMAVYSISAGGLGTGLCWWNSRFQRAATYLIDFHPDLPPPSAAQAEELFRKVTHFKPVRIGGFRSLNQLAATYGDELSKVLTEWQVRTTLFSPGHVLGTTVTSLLPQQELNRRTRVVIKRLIRSFSASPRPIFLKLDAVGPIYIHSVLVVGIREAAGDVTLDLIDGGEHREWKIISRGRLDLQFRFLGDENDSALSLADIDFEEDFAEIEKSLKQKCGDSYRITP